VNVLVTGAGLVGCNTAKQLIERGHQAVLYDMAPNEPYIRSVVPSAPVVRGDVQDMPTVIETLQKHKVEVIAHTAFLIGGSINERPFSGVRANVEGALTLAEAARLTRVKRFLFAGTFGVYDWEKQSSEIGQVPISEDFPVISGDHFYLASKLAAEGLLGAFAKHYGFEYAIVRFAQIYGRGHYAAGDYAGPAMHNVLAKAVAGEHVQVDPGVLTCNDYVYAKDVAQGMALACERPLRHRIYHLGSGKLGSPEDVASAIRQAVPGASVEVLPKPVVGPFWRHEQVLDLRRTREDIGYEPRYDLVKGVADFADELRRLG
jgi:UDP-glucose 4-epimerase